jgi:hypothetical protein
MNKLIEVATDSRYHCTCCGHNIKKGEKYFRDAKSSGMRFSHTVNICRLCIARLFLKADITEEEVDNVRDDIMINKIEAE